MIMKKILFTMIAVTGISAVSFGQTAMGQWLVGGSAGFNYQKEGEFNQTTISFAPDAGYFVIDDLAIGAMLDVTSTKEKGSSASTYFLGAPFVRFYFVPLGDKAKLFANGSFGFGSVDFGGPGGSTNFTQWSIGAGPAVFLNPHTALEFTIAYSSQKIKDDADHIDNFGVNIGFQIHLGEGKKMEKK